ncbi:uncharacterized protein BX663DRAFT_522148 [Cokeromyces recurvatus]|uniref:uncharacterized protein n=1 Tax=Cokeromyces recurvatus TaxID=90255 RepID=UPI00221F2ECE|nr:uncharacterized protein BX663DRAFT_522148 [Cokeromyces recurvatus]KAI7899307.1 hypothetical protein BX663DRAFT_522148 [Cokeromyces recurvatus]
MCFPLRGTYIPSYMMIDTMILSNHIVNPSQRSNLDKKTHLVQSSHCIMQSSEGSRPIKVKAVSRHDSD